MGSYGPEFQSLVASIVLALLVPVEFYANVRGFSENLPHTLIIVTMIATPLGAVILGHAARGQVRRSGYIRSGYGTGSTGMILGYLVLSAYLYLVFILTIHPVWH